MIKSESVLKIFPDLIKAQAEMSKPKKESNNPYFKSKYADLSSILEAVQPSLNAHGIGIIQPVESRDGKDFVKTLLIHASGEFIGSEVEIKNLKPGDSQAFGSGVSYARRYALQALLGLSAVDDDGNKATIPDKAMKEKTNAKIDILEKISKAQDVPDLNNRFHWYKENKPEIFKEHWFQEAYNEKATELTAEKKFFSKGKDIADEAIKAGI